MTIREIIKQFFSEFISQNELYSKYGIVTQVHTDNTCDISFEGFPTMERVPFAGVPDASNLVIEPAVNTKVLVTFTSFQTAFISYVVEPKSIKLKSEDAEIILADKITLNGGENSGLVLINPLVEKINALEGELNDLKTLLSTWVVAPGDGGLALKTILASWYAQQITPTNKNELENTKILQ